MRTVTPTLDGDVLRVLARANASFTGRQVHRLIGRASETGVRRALERLVDQGVVLRTPAGQAYLYRLNREHLAADHIVALATLTGTLISLLRSEVAGWAVASPAVVLFGSTARGEADEHSDVDLLVLRSPDVDPDDHEWRSQLEALADRVRAWTGNDAEILEYAEHEADPDREPMIADADREGVVIAGSLRRRARNRQDAAGRLRKAREWRDQAENVRRVAEDDSKVASTIVALSVQAGIAAADCICHVALGRHASGEDRRRAIALLAEATPDERLSLDLDVLLGLKDDTQYGPEPPEAHDVVRALHAAERLVSAAEDALSAAG